VIATGKQHSVRDFINEAAKNLDMNIEWKGKI
jgi:GDP-D-mannose dehydratase